MTQLSISGLSIIPITALFSYNDYTMKRSNLPAGRQVPRTKAPKLIQRPTPPAGKNNPRSKSVAIYSRTKK